MLALYRSGRQAEALAVYRDTRRMLSDELGIEPGPRLHELERAILRHEPSLEPSLASGADAVVTTRRRRRLAAGAGAVAAAAVGVALVLAFGADTPVAVGPNSVAVIDPGRNEVVEAIPVGEAPGPIAAGAGRVWVLNRNSRTLSEIDPRTRRVLSTSGLTHAKALAVGEVVYVLDGHDEVLHHLDPRTKSLHGSVRVDRSGQALPGADIAVWGDEVWVTDELPAAVVRVRLDVLGTEAERLDLPGSPSAVAAEAERVWVALDDGRLVLVDRRTRSVERTLELGRSASAVAVGGGAVWIADDEDGTVSRVLSRPLQFVARIEVGRAPGGLAFGAGSVWVANRADGTVSRIDPRTNTVTATIRIGRRPEELVFAGGLVWVSVR
jgi:YVTN family beta-propeller protein